MGRNRYLGWGFSCAVAAAELYIFWDGLLPHPAPRPKFQPPVSHPQPVEMPIVAPMELPPPPPKPIEAAPKLPVLPPLQPVTKSK